MSNAQIIELKNAKDILPYIQDLGPEDLVSFDVKKRSICPCRPNLQSSISRGDKKILARS